MDGDGKPLNGGLKQHGNSGVYRINRNLALSRAIGDRSELPFVSSKVVIEEIELDEEKDEFVVVGSDGLWDVLSSQEVVGFCHNVIRKVKESKASGVGDGEVPLDRVRRKMSKLLVREALRRGSMDNITVVIIWLSS